MCEKNKIASDSIILIFVKCITMIVGIVQAMVLSRTFSISEYGIYSQAMLIISMCTTILGLGLNNGISYFFNKTENYEEKKMYVNTIFCMSLFLGVAGGIVLVLNKANIINYFENDKLAPIIIYTCFRPLVINLIGLYQQLYVSIGMAKTIALRNLIISLLQIVIVAGVSLLTKNIVLIFLLLLILDIGQLYVFSVFFKKRCFKIDFFNVSIGYIKPILIYVIPLALALMMGNILKDMDKLIIGKLLNTEALGLYTNVSRPLPFEFIGTSFTIVVTPIIIKLISKKRLKDVQNLWSDYLEIGYMTTWILCTGAIICAPELLIFLYSEKYLAGLNIFIVYIIVEMFRFTYFGMILSAKAKTKWILIYSFITLILNLTLNLVLFYAIGIVGPAIASLLSIIIIGLIQLIHSSKILNVKFIDIIKVKRVICLILQLIIVSLICLNIKAWIGEFITSNFIKLTCIYSMFVACMLVVNYKRITELIKNLNSY